MQILVCGAGGMLGQDLLRAAKAAGYDVAGLARADLDVTDRGAVRAAVADAKPGVVINCAAWTDVDGAEQHPEAAERVNGEGAGNVAAAAAAVGASVLYVSTDYVFDGTKGEPYLEEDEPAPLSAYGRSKLAGEQATAGSNPRHFVVRSSWLFGTHGGNFVATMLYLGGGREEVRVIDDQVGCPTWTGHLAEGLLGVAAGEAYGVHHLAGGGGCSWCDLARELFRRANVECELLPIKTEDYPLPARRPAYSVLRSSRGIGLPSWQEGLERYLGEREALAA
jgi:dTDP-4-dehydrorhamnose reductase